MNHDRNSEEYLIGIDAGCTVVKAVIFDSQGREIARAGEKVPVIHKKPGWAERDMNLLWELTKKAIRNAIKKSSIDPRKIVGVGVTGHGDGLYLLDEDGNPVRNAILSFDSRASDVIKEWKTKGIMDELFPIIGQYPFEGCPLALLSWIKRNEPQKFEKIRWIIACKDYIKFKLTNVICTDETDASATLTNYKTGSPDPEIYELVNLPECRDFLPEIVKGWNECGRITSKAALETGLPEGAVVASGLHDIDATALGSGCFDHGDACLIIGTWGINEVVSSEPLLDPERKCMTRRYGAPGRWLILFVGYTKASASNLEWFIRECGRDLEELAKKKKTSPYKLCDDEASSIPPGSEGVLYLPFLEGILGLPEARAGFYGIGGWHTRGHLIRAIFEGVAFATKLCLNELNRVIKIKTVKIAGGGARSPVWSQIMADVLGMDIEVPEGTELGAKGAAICAAIASGLFENHRSALQNMVSISKKCEVDDHARKEYERAYEKFLSLLKWLEGT